MAKATDATTPEVEAPQVDTVADEVTTTLLEHGVDNAVIEKIKQFGVTSVTDLSMLTESEFVEAGLAKIQARKLVGVFIAPPAAITNDGAVIGAAALENVLPSVPSDESWLESLRTGGVLKVDSSTVIASIRAALANRVGLFDVPSKLVSAMEEFAESNEEPVDPLYFKLREQLTRRNYGDIFSAIPGMTGSYVTKERKERLFMRINQYLWPSIIEFYGQLQSWQQAWMQGVSSPALLFASLGNNSMGLPPGMIQPPDTAGLHDQAEAVTDASNKVFGGVGVQIAAAMAYDASEIKKSLQDPRLPALVGATNRDQMLKQLKVSVSATYPRLELNLTRFVLATLQAKDQPSGNEELQYFGALYQLGSQIPWDQLTGTDHTSLTGIGGREKLHRSLGAAALAGYDTDR
jgi:hypothetical protein